MVIILGISEITNSFLISMITQMFLTIFVFYFFVYLKNRKNKKQWVEIKRLECMLEELEEGNGELKRKLFEMERKYEARISLMYMDGYKEKEK